MTTSPAEELAVVDNLRCRKELEALEVAWPGVSFLDCWTFSCSPSSVPVQD
jgi:hypothetical protein